MKRPPSVLIRKARERLRTNDLSLLSSEERSRERNKRVGLTLVGSIAARGIGTLTVLFAIPLAVGYLGLEQYGLFVTITSLGALLGIADLGLSSGLMNKLSEASGTEEKERVQEYVSSAFFLLLVLATLLAIVFTIVYGWVPWPQVFNVSSSSAAEVAGRSSAAFVAVTLLGVPLSAVPRIQLGLQEGFKSSMWQAAGNVLSLVLLVVAITMKASLPLLVLAMGAGPVFAALLNGLLLLGERPWLRPRLRLARVSAAKEVMRLGFLFFILQIAVVAAYQTDNIIIAQILGVAKVTEYAVPMRLFLTIPLLLSLGLLPLWPAYSEALARGDAQWVRSTLVRSLWLTLALSVFLGVALLWFGPGLVQMWVGASVTPSFSLLLALGIWTVVYSVSIAVAMFLNGANAVGFQACLAIGMLVLNLPLSIAFTNSIGLAGPAWGSTCAVAICILLPSAFYLRRRLRSLGAESFATEGPASGGQG